MSNTSSVAQNVISLPKGGGAIKGIGETFQPNLFSGTGNHAIPIAISPGRGGFGPTLSLQYSSGNGNGPFGLGWQLSIPRITRKTEKGLPQYNDTDVFVMSGAEDLVPCLKTVVDPTTGTDTWEPEEPIHRPLHTVYRYRPRTEGLFARIERWEHDATHEVHWRATTKDNITSIYGGSSASRLADPDNEQRVYEWLLQETFDATGNHILYEYATDHPKLYTHDDPSLAFPAIFDRNRNATQLYIRRIYYGNLPDPLLDSHGNAVTYPDGTAIGPLREGRRFAFEVLFDYGEWEIPTTQPHPDPAPAGQQELFGSDPALSAENNPVPIRDDCFSSFRAGFEIRTLRRCRRILMFHHFAELGSPTLVRSTDFTYHNNPETLVSFLTAVTVTGYQKDAAGHYQSAGMPPVTFTYAEFRPQEQRYQSIVAQGNEMPPQALNNPNVALVDLFGDGLPDVLHSSPAGFRYWRNLGGGRLDRPRFMPQVPAGIALAQPGVGFGDMGGDGQADLLVHAGPLLGFFETTSNGTWQKFKRYDVFPSFELADPNVRMVDLTGNGLSDALMTGDQYFLWFECLGEHGFAEPKRIARQYDLDTFPDVFFNDPEGRVRLADMTGDGLHDIVLVHNGRIDYWPNLGYGRFGKRLTMANAPRLELNFDPERLFLADLNGNGCADLVYVDVDRVSFWFNQSGNRWSEQQTITGTPRISDVDSIQFADVFGTGTATLLWSHDFNGQGGSNYKALDVCGGIKPYVLTEMSNNMGATTRVSYAPSTKYFLEDQAHGTPWVTKLPFPVQVVDKLEVIDHLSKTKLVTTYQYHHGYFDGREREFRGFGRVDQFDTETFEDFTQSSLHDGADLFDNNERAFHVPPVETRSWFHTGIYFAEDPPSSGANPFDFKELTKEFRKEFYQGDAQAVAVDDHHVETGDTPHEAYRALRGAVLRTEVYARDGSAKAAHPYQVTDNRYQVQQVQPKDGNHHGVYFSNQMESVSYQYERNPTDPRISHALTLQVDAFGNPLRSLAIGYGRRQPDSSLPTSADRDKQTQTFLTYTENSYTNGIDDPIHDPDPYRTPLPSETRTYELTGFVPANHAQRFSVEEWVSNEFAQLNGAVEVPYEAVADLTKTHKRLITHVRSRYRKNDMTDLLPLGAVESLALPGENYKLAFTPGLLMQVYGTRVTDTMLANEGRYVHSEGDANWWMPSGRVFYSPNVADTPAQELAVAQQHFFPPHRFQDPFGNTAVIGYDVYDLLVTHTTDPLGNTATAEQEYRLLQPFRIIDPNGNRAEVAFDTLGLVAGTAFMGKTTETKGDSLTGFVPNLTTQQRQDFLADPLGQAALLLGQATTRIVYDLDRYRTSQQPVFAATLARETHVSDPLPTGGLKVQVSLSYSDGFGREIQKKIQAEPGPVPKRDAAGQIMVDADGRPEMTPNEVSPRWVGSGWTIFNNKGKPVRQFEPFFTDTHHSEFDVRIGVSPVLFYDPVERVVATLHPNHTWEKVLFDPWQQESWDVNDTVLIADPKTDPEVGEFFRHLPDAEYLPTWHGARQDGQLGPEEQAAAAKTAFHSGTPLVAHDDSLGRTFLTVAHNKFERNGTMLEEKYATRIELDIDGNQREVIDAKDRVVMRYDYDMLSNGIHQASMEAGKRWMLNDVVGKPLYTWDSRGFLRRITYDALRRSTETFVTENGFDRLDVRMVYGESQGAANNHRTRVFQVFDGAGVVTGEAYDFKGNLLRGRRDLLPNYQQTVDWQQNPAPNDGIFTSNTIYDALNRPTAVTAPDNSTYHPIYNEANLLDKVEVNLPGAAAAMPFVTNINYDAKGQRELIAYGNGAQTHYEYDPLTFRLTRLRTTRSDGLNGLASQLFTDPAVVQDLRYTYDPAGNITHIEDVALQTIVHNSEPVQPVCAYIYDAVYRLIEAQGREHIGQTAHDFHPPDGNRRDFDFAGLADFIAHPNDMQALRNYTERYEYDGVGNFQFMRHSANGGSWTRGYEYDAASLIEPTKRNNRLTRSTVGNGPNFIENYTYTDAQGNDVYGCITAINNMKMVWNSKDQLQQVDLGGGGTAYYVYDGGGQRVRKVIETQNGARKQERIYLGGFEMYREYDGGGTGVTLERETLHIMDDKQRIALVETKTIDNQSSIPNPQPLIRYQFGNHLGSASLELGDAGQIVSYEEYTPYGSTSYQAGRSAVEVSLKRYRYTGKERDEESGLYYHGARYYAPWAGRWVSCDPAGIAGGLNLYSYVLSNPLRLLDHLGMQPETTDINEPLYIGEQTIEMSEKWSDPDPRQAALTWAAKNDYINLHSLAEHERQLSFDKASGTSDYSESWTQEDWDRYQENPTEEVRADIAQSKWKEFVNQDYAKYRERRAAEWEKSTRMMDSLGKLGKGIAGVTVAIAGVFALATAVPAGSLIGGGLGVGGGTTTTAGASTLSTTIATSAPRIAQAVSGAGGATVLANEAQEEAPVIADVATAGLQRVNEAATVLGEGSEGYVKVVTELEINGQRFMGWNGKWFNPFSGLNFHWGHAEVDVLGKAYTQTSTIGNNAVMWVTESLCSSCLYVNVPKAVEQMGLESLTIHTPIETLIFGENGLISWLSR